MHFLTMFSSDSRDHTFIHLGVGSKVAFGRPASATQRVTHCVHWTPEVTTPWSKNGLSGNPSFSPAPPSFEERSVELHISIRSSSPASGHPKGSSFLVYVVSM